MSPREGLEPCHSRLSLHQLSLIAREDSGLRARSFLILFSAFRRVKGELLLLIFSLICFFFSVIPTILSSGVTPTPFTACPRLHLPKIMTKAQALLNRGGDGRSALEEGVQTRLRRGASFQIYSVASLCSPRFIPYSPGGLGSEKDHSSGGVKAVRSHNDTPGCLRQWGPV